MTTLGTTSFSAAEDFVISGGVTQLGTLTWWGAYTSNTPLADSFTINIHENRNGLPSNTLLFSASGITPSRVATGNKVGFFDEYQYTSDLSSVVLSPGTYFLEIFNDTPTSSYWAWETGDLDMVNGIPNYAFARQTPGTNWGQDRVDLAFRITAVPEPTSFIMFGTALLAGARRRRIA